MEHTPRNFALQLGALVALYATVASLITLLFGAITLTLPDAADSSWQLETAAESIRFAFATLVIVFPTFLILTRRVNVLRRAEDSAYLGLTRWLIYLSLLVGGAVLLGDAVAVVYNFLNGEITLRFFLKALVLAGVVAAAFSYYLLDARGYWKTHEKHSIYFGYGSIVVVLAALVWGYTNIETPAEVREMRIDEEQVSDLRDIQWAIESYLVQNNEVPSDLTVAYSPGEPPVSPEGRRNYSYEVTEDGFNLCAEFGRDSVSNQFESMARPVAPTDDTLTIINPHNWQYEAGEWCFERVVR